VSFLKSIRPPRPLLSVLSILLSILAFAAVAPASEPYEKLYPLFPDLPGWEGDTPQGMSMSANGQKATTASRTYQAEGKSFTVTVLKGYGTGAVAGAYQDVQLETDEVSVTSGEMRGFRIFQTWQKKENSGNLLVSLAGENADEILNFDYTGMSRDEAMPLIDRFDWKAIAQTMRELP
jgi:hypothetical protein